MTSNIAMIGKMWEKKGKILQIWSMTKKGHKKFLPRKLGARSPPLVIIIVIT